MNTRGMYGWYFRHDGHYLRLDTEFCWCCWVPSNNYGKTKVSSMCAHVALLPLCAVHQEVEFKISSTDRSYSIKMHTVPPDR